MLGVFGFAVTGCDKDPMEQRVDELEERGERIEEIYDDELEEPADP